MPAAALAPSVCAIPRISLLLLSSGLGLAACDAPAVDAPQEPALINREAWHDLDDPSLIDGSFNYVFAELPTAGEAERVPWPGSYWPMFHDGINDRWAGDDVPSPAEKYGQAFGKDGVEDAVSRRYGVDSLVFSRTCKKDADCQENQGSVCAKRRGEATGRCSETWFGICEAWAPAAVLEPEPRQAVTYNGVEFKVNDIKALISIAYTAGLDVRYVSLRCDEKGKEEDLGDVDACRDTNPGTFHVVVANLLGLRGESFIEDRTYDYEVWNQPIRSYKVTKNTELTPAEANALLGAHGEALRSEHRSGSVSASAWKDLGSVPLAGGETLRVRMTGTGDADLYVRWEHPPTADTFSCRPFIDGSLETCELEAPPGTTRAHVAVQGYLDSTYDIDIDVFGGAAQGYAFNPKAASLRRIRTELRWVAESPSHVDGPLLGRIDQFTMRENYDYVLELDEDGRIIGGEWLGATRTNHPDFLWRPVRKRDVLAVGVIDYGDVKKLLELAAGP